MAGLVLGGPVPTEIKLHQTSKMMDLVFDDGFSCSLSYEFLRVMTPSAEARGHGPGQGTLQVGKRNVAIDRVDVVGNYAIRPVFDDGHDSGIYSWDLLYRFGRDQESLWSKYLEQLTVAGLSRDAVSK